MKGTKDATSPNKTSTLPCTGVSLSLPHGCACHRRVPARDYEFDRLGASMRRTSPGMLDVTERLRCRLNGSKRGSAPVIARRHRHEMNHISLYKPNVGVSAPLSSSPLQMRICVEYVRTASRPSKCSNFKRQYLVFKQQCCFISATQSTRGTFRHNCKITELL